MRGFTMGTQALSKNLPIDRENLIKRIKNIMDQIREQADVYYQEKEYIRGKKRVVKSALPHNFISILGGRGSGKTSIMLTLLKQLEDEESLECSAEKCPNIILPVLDPDRFNLENDILGWIIFNFQKIVERYTSKQNINYCDYDEEIKKMEGKFDILKESYIQSRYLYLKNIKGFSDGLYEYKKQNEKSYFADMHLFENFHEFIDTLVLLIRKMNGTKGTQKQPLFILPFDDIDLNSQQGPKILKTILNFLNHHAIVVLALGNYETFVESLVIDFWNRENIPGNIDGKATINNQSVLDTRYIRAEEFLLKVFPPVYRNNLRDLTPEERLEFTPYAKEEIDTLDQILGEVGIELNQGKEAISLRHFMYRPIIDVSELTEDYDALKNKKSNEEENEDQHKNDSNKNKYDSIQSGGLTEYFARFNCMQQHYAELYPADVECKKDKKKCMRKDICLVENCTVSKEKSIYDDVVFFANVLPQHPRGLMNFYTSLKQSKIFFECYPYGENNIITNYEKYSEVLKRNFNNLIQIYNYFVDNVPDLKMFSGHFNISDVIKIEIDSMKITFDYSKVEISARDNFRSDEFNISKKLIVSCIQRRVKHELNAQQSAFIQFFHDLVKLVLPASNIIILRNGTGLQDIVVYRNHAVEVKMINFEFFSDYYLFMEMYKIYLPLILNSRLIDRLNNVKIAFYQILTLIEARNKILRDSSNPEKYEMIKMKRWIKYTDIKEKMVDFDLAPDNLIRKNIFDGNDKGLLKFNILEFINFDNIFVEGYEGYDVKGSKELDDLYIRKYIVKVYDRKNTNMRFEDVLTIIQDFVKNYVIDKITDSSKTNHLVNCNIEMLKDDSIKKRINLGSCPIQCYSPLCYVVMLYNQIESYLSPAGKTRYNKRFCKHLLEKIKETVEIDIKKGVIYD